MLFPASYGDPFTPELGVERRGGVKGGPLVSINNVKTDNQSFVLVPFSHHLLKIYSHFIRLVEGMIM